MATQYFGAVTDTNGTFDSINYYFFDFGNDNYATGNNSITFTCPGTGTKDIKALGFYNYPNSANGYNVKIAIYSTNLQTLYAYGGTITVTNSAGWLETTSITKLGTINGGTNYSLQIDPDNAVVAWSALPVSTGSAAQVASTYSSFPPSTLTLTSYIHVPALRCGVDTAAAGGANWLKEGYWWDNPYRQKALDMPKDGHFRESIMRFARKWRRKDRIFVPETYAVAV